MLAPYPAALHGDWRAPKWWDLEMECGSGVLRVPRAAVSSADKEVGGRWMMIDVPARPRQE